MASITVNINTTYFYDFETNTHFVTVDAGGTKEVTRGDTITFRYNSRGTSSVTPPVVIAGFDSSVFTNTSNITLSSVGASVTKTIKSDASYITDTLNLTATYSSGVGSDTLGIRVLNPVDNVPDSFSLGPNRTGFPAGQTIQLGYVRVSGVNTGVTCRITDRNNFEFRVNNGSWRTANITVQSGDIIYLRVITPQSFSTTVTTRLYLNDVYDAISITTGNENSVRFISSGITSLPVKFSDVYNFFGKGKEPGTSIPLIPRLSQYVRGGQFVPNITENSAIETALPLDLDSFVGSGTSMYFQTFPQSKGTNANVVTYGATMTIAWTEGIDYVIGYGEIRENVQYSIVLESYTVMPASTGAGTLTFTQAGTGSPSDWSGKGKSVSLSLPVSAGSEGQAIGELKISARYKQDNSTTISATVPFSFGWVGP